MGRLKDILIDQMEMEDTNEVFIDNNFSKFHRNNVNVFHLIVQYADESAKKRNRYSIDRLSASYEVASGQPWVAPRKRENIVPIRPKFSERKSYDKVVLS